MSFASLNFLSCIIAGSADPAHTLRVDDRSSRGLPPAVAHESAQPVVDALPNPFSLPFGEVVVANAPGGRSLGIMHQAMPLLTR
jgi:hypothetical protein